MQAAPGKAKLFQKVGNNLLKLENVKHKKWNRRVIGFQRAKKVLLIFENTLDFKQYVEDPNPMLVEETIVLANASLFLPSGYISEPAHVFELHTPQENHFFASESAESTQTWITTLASAGVPLKTSDLPKDENLGQCRRIFGMQGYLKKRGEVMTGWKVRFLRTMENARGNQVVAYFAKHWDVEPKGVIKLEGARVERGDQPLHILIVTGPRTFVLQAETEEEHELWVRVLTPLADGSYAGFYDTGERGPQTLYDVLGVAVDCSTEDIVAAYKRLRKELHPDRNPDPQATQRFQQTQEAYETLHDPVSRAKYDKRLLGEFAVPASKRARIRKRMETAAKASAVVAPVAQVATAAAGEEKKEEKKEEAAGFAKEKSNLELEKMRYPHKFCGKCRNKHKASYCHTCRMDLCIQCSLNIHRTLSKPHQRMPLTKKEAFLTSEGIPFESDAEKTVRIDSELQMMKEEEAKKLFKQRQKEEEERKRQHAAALKAKQRLEDSNIVEPYPGFKFDDEMESYIELLQKGTLLWKVPRRGAVKKTRFYLLSEAPPSEGERARFLVYWESSTKKRSETTVNVARCQLLLGQSTKGFKKKKVAAMFGDKPHLSFSLQTRKRLVDIVCPDPDMYSTWTRVLDNILRQLKFPKGTIKDPIPPIVE